MARISDPEGIVALLQDDIRGEHAAIIQYLQHAYRIGQGDLPSEIEEIAREEMRHFRWLCEMVVALGGNPTIERDAVFLDAPSDVDLLRLDIDAEERAIAQYRDHIERIDHPETVRLLRRILADELAHREGFGGFVEELGGEPTGTQAAGVGPWGGGPREADLALAEPAAAGPFGAGDGQRRASEGGEIEVAAPGPNVRLINQMNADIRAEYATVLRQLHLAFVTPDPRLSKELLESHAQWHMKHMGWLSERVTELGGTPDCDPGPVALEGDPRNRLARELQQQGSWVAHVGAERDRADDPESRFILDRIHTHDAFAVEQLIDLLSGPVETAPPPTARPSPAGRLTVGSLLGQRQT